MNGRCSVILVAALLAGGCTRPAGEPIRIGHLAAFSGAEKIRGEHSRHGIQLALQEAQPELETVLGRKVVFLHADHQGKAATLQAEAVRLVAVSRVKALVADCDPDLAEQVARATQGYEVPVVLTGALPAPRPGVVALGLEGGVRGRALARLALERLKVKTAAVLVSRRDGAAPGLAEAFVREWRSAKGDTVHEWGWEREGELPEVARRAAKTMPGAVLIGAGLEGFQRARSDLEGLEGAGVETPVLFGGGDTGPELVRDGTTARAGLYLATAFAADGLTDAGRDVARRYEEAFHERLELDAAQGYDAARFLFEALRRSRAAGSQAFPKELAKIDTFEALTGPLTVTDGAARRPVFLVETGKGSTRLLESVPAGKE